MRASVLQPRTGAAILSHGFGRGPRIPACPPVSQLNGQRNLDCREHLGAPNPQGSGDAKARPASSVQGVSSCSGRRFFVATLPFGPLVPRCGGLSPSPVLLPPHTTQRSTQVWTTSLGGGPMCAVSAPPSDGLCTPSHDSGRLPSRPAGRAFGGRLAVAAAPQVRGGRLHSETALLSFLLHPPF